MGSCNYVDIQMTLMMLQALAIMYTEEEHVTIPLLKSAQGQNTNPDWAFSYFELGNDRNC